ncbi:MAG: hypothetical protein IJ613_08120 [Muribaculaceae bacterium]|nr:hypothetical protein [Muribaculaceae bacterium]
MDTSVLITIILSAAGIAISIIWGYMPKRRMAINEELKEKLEKREHELLTLYQDVQTLLRIEEDLTHKASLSKRKVRKGKALSCLCEPARVTRRIRELTIK